MGGCMHACGSTDPKDPERRGPPIAGKWMMENPKI